MRRDDYELLERIPPELEAIHARLENWARWSRDRRPQGHCRSIEYRYKSTDVWQDSEPRTVFDTLAALEVHKVVAAMPVLHRHLLHYWYIKSMPVKVIRMRLGLTRQAVVHELNKARRMASNRK